ncbi:MAG: hypothetical protein R2708_26760 [Vicinamibacterales bacterium]
MDQGCTMLAMGWQWDVPAGRMRMAIPIATDHERVITGLVRGNFIPGAHATTASIADRGHDACPVVDPESAEHVLYVRAPAHRYAGGRAAHALAVRECHDHRHRRRLRSGPHLRCGLSRARPARWSASGWPAPATWSAS